MTPITSLYPCPRPVTLGTRSLLIGEMRVSDMVRLQSWLDRLEECPLRALRGSLSDLQEPERTNALLRVWDALEAGPALFGTPRADRLFNTVDGIHQVFMTVLPNHNPEFKDESGRTKEDMILEVGGETTPEQYQELLEAWSSEDTKAEVARLMGWQKSAGGDGPPIGWPQAILELCEMFGWTLDYVSTLTMGQVRTARRMGKPIEYGGVTITPDMSVKAVVKRRKAELRAKGITDPEPEDKNNV